MKAEEGLKMTEPIDGQVDINENQKYDVLILKENGCLNIGGLPDPGVEEIRVKIGELKVDKQEGKNRGYDLKFTAPREGKIKIFVEIRNLHNDIRTLSYAPDGLDGRDGSAGGCGSASMFGMGGRGGDGGDGEDGMDGTDCPEVTIVYGSADGKGISHTAVSAAGGRGGAGGKGGEGGLCSDGETHAASGMSGRNGRDGRPGGKGSIMIKSGQDMSGIIFSHFCPDAVRADAELKKEEKERDGYS